VGSREKRGGFAGKVEWVRGKSGVGSRGKWSGLAWLCPIVAGLGFVGPSWNVSVQTYRMQITPNEMLGRTSSVAVQIAWGVIPLGSLLAGFLLQAMAPSAAMAVVAAGMAVTAVAATALAPVRDAGRRTPGASGPAGASEAAGAAGAAGTAPAAG